MKSTSRIAIAPAHAVEPRISEPAEITAAEERALLTLLDHHFGDGSIYLRSELECQCFARAVRLGLVNAEGYLTDLGYCFWRQREG